MDAWTAVNLCLPVVKPQDSHMMLTNYGHVVASLYVGMARFQDGGTNQCISIHGDIITREQIACI